MTLTFLPVAECARSMDAMPPPRRPFGAAARGGRAPERAPERRSGIMRAHLAELGLRLDIAAAAEAGSPPEVQVTEMVRALLVGIHAERHAHGILVRDLRKLPMHEQIVVRQRCKRLAHAFVAPLIEAVPALKLRPAEARAMALSLFGMASTSAAWYEPEGAVNVARYAQALTAMTLAGASELAG